MASPPDMIPVFLPIQGDTPGPQRVATPELTAAASDDRMRRQSSAVSPGRNVSSPVVPSPPPTPRSRTTGIKINLKSASGWTLHTNEDALQQYTDYNPNGSSRSPRFASVSWRGADGTGTSDGADELPLKLEIPDFLSRDMFQLVLDDADAMERLLKFAENRAMEESVDFLIKVYEYNRMLEDAVERMSAIVATLTTSKLPSHTATTLDNDAKKATSSSVPHLQAMFNEPRELMENQVFHTLYPAFVKHQIATCTGLALSCPTGALRSQFPGLADAFCLMNPFMKDKPVASASHSFIELTGYDWSKQVAGGGTFLNGTSTSKEVLSRIRDAMLRREEVVELILSYPMGGSGPFWNFVYVSPLLDDAGTLCYYFVAQTDVSHELEGDGDVLAILGARPSAAERRPRVCGVATPSRESEREREKGRESSSFDSGTNRRSLLPLSKDFLRPFRRATNAISPATRPAIAQSSYMQTPPSLNRSPSVSSCTDALQNVYSRFLVLQSLQFSSAAPVDQSRNRRPAPILEISFFSRGAPDILGLDMAADSIMGKDIFAVLAEQAGSPSISKAFRAAVREAVVRGTETLRLELEVKREVASEGGWKMGDWGSRRGSWTENLVTYWTPMKGHDGSVEWVVLTVSPLDDD